MHALLLMLALAGAQPAERIADIQIHGNTLTTDARILEIAGIQIGAPVGATTMADVTARLRQSDLFDHIEVLKRFASIADSSQIAIVIVVDDKGRVAVLDGIAGAPGAVVKRRGPNLMILPIITVEDGYGVAYGAQLSVPEPLGAGSRLSFPLTWGGDKRAGVETEVPLSRGPVTRVKAGAAITRREHPFFEQNDDRRTGWARAERDITRVLRLGVTATLEEIAFLDDRDHRTELGVDAVADTRVDPFLPGNAVYGRAAWSRLAFGHSTDTSRSELEARGYVSTPRGSVLVVRALRQSSRDALPEALKPILGGASNLRGFPAGFAVGDTLTAASVEWRVPLNSPINRGKVGVSAFADLAMIYDKGRRFRDERAERSVGVGVWMVATVFRANLYVAHGLGGDTRAHVMLSSSF